MAGTSFAQIDLFPRSVGHVQVADQFPPATVTAPQSAAGISSTATGGTVAAGTYEAEVTFIGSSGGETTASAASASFTTTGSTSTLIVAPLDNQMGSASFNVYVQTTSGSFWKQSGCNATAIGTPCVIKATPVTTGTNPPGSNTATSVLPGAQNALGGQGAVIIPSNLTNSAGTMGQPTSNQILFDYRNASIAITSSGGQVQKSAAAANPNFASINLDFLEPSGLGANQSATGMNINAHAANSPTYFAGPSTGPNLAAMNLYNERQGSRAENIWAIVGGITCNNTNNKCINYEADMNNGVGLLTQSYNGGVGFAAETNIGPNWGGFYADRIASPATFLFGFGCNANAIQNSSTSGGGALTGSCFSAPATSNGLIRGLDTGSAVHAYGDGTFNSIQIDTSAGSTQNALDFKDNGTSRWQLLKTTGNDLNISPQAGAGKFFIPPVWLTETTAPSSASGFDVCYADSTLHMLKCNNNGTSYLAMGQTGNSAGTHSDSGFYQSASAAGCTTAASIGGTCATATTITWPVAFADANYKVTCQGSGAITNFPIMGSVTARVAANATVQTMALTAAAASFATIECIAVHN